MFFRLTINFFVKEADGENTDPELKSLRRKTVKEFYCIIELILTTKSL